jgi:hypothetical protein
LCPMRICFLFLLITLHQFLYSQEEPQFPDMRSWQINTSDTTERYIFADTAFIRISPDTKQPSIDTLLAGDNITITGVTPNALTIRGIKGPWLKINYTKNGSPKNGYIWQGLVSCMPLRRGDIKFVYAIERRVDSIKVSGKERDTIRRFLVTLKVVQDGKVLVKSSVVTPDDESANFSFAKVMSGMGLTSVQNIIVLTFGGEACGIPEYNYYIALTKSNQLVRLPDKMNVADAGVFNHAETFTFPNEKNGKPDMVIWNMITEEGTEKIDKNGDLIFKTIEKKTANYMWDGVNGKICSP